VWSQDPLKAASEFPTGTVVFSKQDGNLLISSAREAISTYLTTHQIVVPQRLIDDPRFEMKLGCFVTLKQNDVEKTLRGCIGFPEPVYKFSKALTEAAIYAATEDPRFEPINIGELQSLLVEVSVLSTPTLIDVKSPRELPKMINVGKDGLIMRWSFGSGLLLPQVAIEQGWDAGDFLANLSMKAGAPPDQWLVPGTLVLKFQAQIFSEEDPNGPVIMLGD
jgi:uncharacterized protein (TIGR00296 family)